MPPFSRLALAIVAASTVALAACNKPAEKTAAAKPAADAAKDGQSIAGLPTEKDRVSYMVGMALGKQLEPMKDEIDLDVMTKAVRATLKGEKLLMTEQQAIETGEAFGRKMQAKQLEQATTEARKNEQAGEAFLAANAKKPNVHATASGLQYEVLKEGNGPKPKADDVVRVNYKGTLLDGEEFDNSARNGGPAEIPLQAVVPGWREGVTLMPVGSKYRFWIPGKLGYGDKVPPGAPMGPNATLVFEVELLDIVKQPT